MSNEIKVKEIRGMFEGPIKPVLLKLAIPIFAGSIVQVLYNVTDTFWIARIDLSDPSYMGGSAIVFPLIFLYIALGNGIIVGVNSLVARAIGEKNLKILSSTAESGMFISLILSVIMLAVIIPFSPNILRALGAEGDYFVHGLEYLIWVIPAGPLLFFSAVFQGMLQGEGLMKYVMNAVIMSTILNILLDPLFIFLLNMQVRGAALATVIAQTIALIYLITVFIRNKSSIKIHWSVSNIKTKTIKNIASIGMPQSFAMIIMSISFFIFNRIVISIDPLALTAFALCGRFEQMMLLPAFALGAAIVTIVGQNGGRGNFPRVRQTMKEAWILGLIAVGVISGIMVSFAPWIFKPFTDVEKIHWYAVTQYRVLGVSYLTALIGITSRSFFQAIGRPMPALFLTLLRLILIAIPISLILVFIFDMGIWGVWTGILTGGILTMFLSIFWVQRTINRLESGQIEMHKV